MTLPRGRIKDAARAANASLMDVEPVARGGVAVRAHAGVVLVVGLPLFAALAEAE